MTVSRYIGAMPVLWLSVLDPSTRRNVVRNSIAVASQLTAGQDPPIPAGSDTTQSLARFPIVGALDGEYPAVFTDDCASSAD